MNPAQGFSSLLEFPDHIFHNSFKKILRAVNLKVPAQALVEEIGEFGEEMAEVFLNVYIMKSSKSYSHLEAFTDKYSTLLQNCKNYFNLLVKIDEILEVEIFGGIQRWLVVLLKFGIVSWEYTREYVRHFIKGGRGLDMSVVEASQEYRIEQGLLKEAFQELQNKNI